MIESEASRRRNARAGMTLFLIYVGFYGGFVLLSAFAPGLMKVDIAGVNLAVVYGMGLILLAFALAMVFTFVTRNRDEGDQQ